MTIRYNIIATNKCGSTILQKVLGCIFGDSKSKTIFNNHNVVTHGEAEYMFSRNTELIDDKIHADDKFVCVPRNPVSMSVSMFYSYAYTHPQNKNQTKKQYKESRLKNQETGLEKYVEQAMKRNSRKIERIFDSKVDKTLIPYELMISNFELFLHQLLDSLNMLHRYEQVYAEHKSDFKPIEDKSDQIVSGKYKGHKRTTDINEWKTKFDKKTLNHYIKMYPIVKTYENYLKSLDIN